MWEKREYKIGKKGKKGAVKTDTENLQSRIVIFTTKDEKKALKNYCDGLGISVNSYVRDLIAKDMQ